MTDVRRSQPTTAGRGNAAPGDVALDALIQQYLPVVYAAARGQLRDATLAEDVTQAVFVVLARKISGLPANAVLSSWLLKVTYLTCLQARRNARRRDEHERRAAQMRPDFTPAAAVSGQLAEEVDVALAHLVEADRSVLTLRYLEQKSVAQVAQHLGISEPAAQKRIGRAMTRLREKLVVSEEQLGTASLAAFFLSQSQVNVPAHLAAQVAHSVAAAGTTGLSTTAGVLSKGVLKALFWSNLKMPLAVAAVAATATMGYVGFEKMMSRTDPISPPVPVAVNPGDIVPKAAPSNIRGAEYPQVDAMRRATFRVYAPLAGQVTVDLGEKYDMIRGEDGHWTATTVALSPGFHYYQLSIDGAAVPDPGSQSFFGVSKIMSGLEVPAEETAFCMERDVPHGEIRARYMYSGLSGGSRQIYVYTPPSYDQRPELRYPVLYLLQGMGEDQRAWVEQGRLGAIMDNLLAEGQAREMLVVVEDAGAAAGFARGGARGSRGRGAETDGVARRLVYETIPEIDQVYRTVPDREHRAMAGSAGGATQALQIVQENLNTFAYVGAFGAQANYPMIPDGFGGLLGNPEEFSKRVRLMYIGAAANENNAVARMFHEDLVEANISHAYQEIPGTYGGWQTWRNGLQDFAGLVFKDQMP
jgi:RNA polymerase sigma factor (sigma-70 family)